MIDGAELVRRATVLGGAQVDARWRALMRLMLDLLLGLPLTGVGAEALRVADAFWNDRGGSAAQLLASKGECWAYLRRKNGSTAMADDDEDRLLRAVLCVLEPEGDEEMASMSAEWFAAMLNRVGGGI